MKILMQGALNKMSLIRYLSYVRDIWKRSEHAEYIEFPNTSSAILQLTATLTWAWR
jgi:hypothetical protein